MARKKFTPKVTSVAPDQYSPFVRRHFDNRRRFSNEKLSHIANTGHQKARFRASFRARVGRVPGLTDRFFRLFSMFLVCLVLFAAVTGAEYSTYERAVGAVYTFTETVSDAATAFLRAIMNTTDYIGTQIKQESLKDGDKCIVAVKIKGVYHEFLCTFRDKGIFGQGVEKFVINETYTYDRWNVNQELICVLGFVNCPDHGIRVYRLYEYKGE